MRFAPEDMSQFGLFPWKNTSNLCSSDVVFPNQSATYVEQIYTWRQNKRNIAWEILYQAKSDGSYIHSETGDSVLHALSRVPMLPSELLFKLQKFIAIHSVDLNLPNHEGSTPLTAFIIERPINDSTVNETGPILSGYLDALIWKDRHRRIRNKININMKDKHGKTALYYAATKGRLESVRSLIDGGANVNLHCGW